MSHKHDVIEARRVQRNYNIAAERQTVKQATDMIRNGTELSNHFVSRVDKAVRRLQKAGFQVALEI